MLCPHPHPLRLSPDPTCEQDDDLFQEGDAPFHVEVLPSRATPHHVHEEPTPATLPAIRNRLAAHPSPKEPVQKGSGKLSLKRGRQDGQARGSQRLRASLYATDPPLAQWTCSVCTLIHDGAKARYLACDVCGSTRPDPP